MLEGSGGGWTATLGGPAGVETGLVPSEGKGVWDVSEEGGEGRNGDILGLATVISRRDFFRGGESGDPWDRGSKGALRDTGVGDI